MWSVPHGTKILYFVLFGLQFVVGLSYLSWEILHRAKGIYGFFGYLWQHAAPLAIASASISLVIVEIIGVYRSRKEIALWLKWRRLRAYVRVRRRAMVIGTTSSEDEGIE